MVTYAHANLIAVLVAVLAAVLLLTLHPLGVALMAACTLSCVSHLIGWMRLCNINLSSISLVPLLLSIGLCIDYCTHIAHAFAEADGNGKRLTASQRTHIALKARGPAVLNAGLSTGLSVLLLAWGGSSIFTTFFWMLLGVVIIGLFHALLVLPTFLSLLPNGGNSGAGEDHPPAGRAVEWTGGPGVAAMIKEQPQSTPATVEMVQLYDGVGPMV